MRACGVGGAYEQYPQRRAGRRGRQRVQGAGDQLQVGAAAVAFAAAAGDDPGLLERTSLLDVFAAGDCVITHHRLLGVTYLPLGTTAHKQGPVAGENALGGDRQFAGSLGT